MKSLIKIFFGLLVIGVVAQALPADRKATEIEKLGKVELEKDSDSDSEEYPLSPFSPRDGFLSGYFNDMFDRMRQQMQFLLSQVPRIGFGIPDGGNTTSVTKVIDGHKVVINETVYSSGNGEDTAAVFKVKIIDIKPDSSEESSESPDGTTNKPEADGTKGSVESLEQSLENEIPKSLRTAHAQKRKVNNADLYNTNSLPDPFKNIEKFEYPEELEKFGPINNPFDWSELESLDEFYHKTHQKQPTQAKPLKNEIESFEDEDKNKVVDLSNDILINTIAEKQGRPVNPNAEVFNILLPQRDLSRDTYINEIAAQQNHPTNPDAELIETLSNPEIFEKFATFPEFNNLNRDTEINLIAAHNNLPLNSDAEFINVHPESKFFYQTHSDDS